MEEDLVAKLLADEGLAALVGARIYWLDRPQADALPSITLQVISPGRTYTYAGATGLNGPRVQVDCWGASYLSAKQIARALVAAIEAPATQGGTWFSAAFLESASDLPPEDLPAKQPGGTSKVYRVTMDFIIWNAPA
jgi:hypothetical protein